MKIIKAGKIEPDYWWIGKQFVCKGGCGCVFELERGDLTSNAPILTHPCPTCKRTLRLKKPITATDFAIQQALFDELFGENGSLFSELFGNKPKV